MSSEKLCFVTLREDVNELAYIQKMVKQKN